MPVIKKYFFLIVTEVTPAGNQTTMLYAGPLSNSIVVLPVGIFDLFVEIYDEADAYGIYDVNKNIFGPQCFPNIAPETNSAP